MLRHIRAEHDFFYKVQYSFVSQRLLLQTGLYHQTILSFAIGAW